MNSKLLTFSDHTFLFSSITAEIYFLIVLYDANNSSGTDYRVKRRIAIRCLPITAIFYQNDLLAVENNLSY